MSTEKQMKARKTWHKRGIVALAGENYGQWVPLLCGEIGLAAGEDGS